MDDLAVLLQADLLAGLHLQLGVHAMAGKERHVLGIRVVHERLRGGAQVEQAALLGLDGPLGAVAVAVEEDALMRRQLALDERGERLVKVLRLLQLLSEGHERIRHSGVEHHVRAGDVEGRARHAELELVAGEGERRGAVTVGVVLRDRRQGGHADVHQLLAAGLVVRAGDQRVDHAGQLVAHVHGDDGGRRLVRAQAVIVARAGHGDAQQILIVVHGLDDRREEQQELRVVGRGRARIEQVLALVGGDGPVVVLAAAVHAVKWLLVEQAHEAVALGHLLHDLHGQLVVIGGDVRGGEDRRELMLARRDLVVLGLRADAQLPELVVQVLHERLDARADRAEVVILQLLALGRHRAEERAAGQDQVRALLVVLLIDEEVLLFRADGGGHAGDLLAKELQHAAGFLADGLHGAQQRGLLVQDLAGVGAERRGDAQRVVLDERIAGRIPGGVASGLKRGAQAAGRERGGVRLALDELLAGELHDDRAVGAGRDERVVLLGGDAGHRLEPVGEVGHALFNRPVLHRIGDHAGDLRIQRRALANGALERLVYVLGQPFLHNRLVENHAAEQFRNLIHAFLSHLSARCAPEV